MPSMVGANQSKGSNIARTIYDGATAIYSLRKIRSIYNGYAVNVRRSSDNAAQDFGFLADGTLDEVSITTFVGANNGFATKWYDQSGNGKHASHATASIQPQIVASGAIITESGKPTLYFFGGQSLRVDFGTVYARPNSVFGLIRNTENTIAQGRHLFDMGVPSGSVNNVLYFINPGSGYRYGMYAGFHATSGLRDTTAKVFTSIFKADQSGLMRFNGVVQTLDGAVGTRSWQPLTIASSNVDSVNCWYGNISEMILFNGADKSSTAVNIEQNINRYYSVY